VRPLTRPGFTLVELLIVLIVGGAVATAATRLLQRQQRFYTRAGSLVMQRVSLRDATGIMPGEIRALSAVDGDVISFSDSSLEMRVTIGSAIACDTVAGGEALHLAPDQLAGATPAVLASFATVPNDGDVALVYDTGTDDPSDDRWLAATIAGVSSGSDLCAASPLAALVGPGAASVRLLFVTGERLPPTVRPGAFVRVVRRVRYRFYRASTGEWFLGHSTWNGTSLGAVQPVSGPFAPYRDDARGGFALRFFDAAGARLTSEMDPHGIARIEISARGGTREALSGGGNAPPDSQTVTIRLRNQ